MLATDTTYVNEIQAQLSFSRLVSKRHTALMHRSRGKDRSLTPGSWSISVISQLSKVGRNSPADFSRNGHGVHRGRESCESH